MALLPKFLLSGASAIFVFGAAAWADPVVSFQGTGADSVVSFQFVSPVALDTPGLSTIFTFTSCNAPSGETCDQVNYDAGSGVLRFVADTSSGGTDTRTFQFADYVNNGTYTSVNGSPNAGIVTITLSTDPTPEPGSAALAALGISGLLFQRCRERRRRRLEQSQLAHR